MSEAVSVDQKRRDDHKPVQLGNRSICPVCGEDTPCLLVENDRLKEQLEQAEDRERKLGDALDRAEWKADDEIKRANDAEQKLQRQEDLLDELEAANELLAEAILAVEGSPFGPVQVCVGCHRRAYAEGHSPYCPVGRAQVSIRLKRTA